MRCCACSTVPPSVSTFVFTAPTSSRTNPFVAHAGTIATASVMIDAVNNVFRMMLFLQVVIVCRD
jgi:hypothetical protein